MRETIEVVVARIDENVEHIKNDYMTESKTDLVTERAVTKHERKRHKFVSMANIVSAFTAVALLAAALLTAFGN